MKKTINKKLTFHKQTVANLSINSMVRVRAGEADTDTQCISEISDCATLCNTCPALGCTIVTCPTATTCPIGGDSVKICREETVYPTDAC